MSWDHEEGKIMEAFEDNAYSHHTIELCQHTGYSWTDIIFVLNRMREKGMLKYLGEHWWKKVSADSSEISTG